MFAIFDTTSRRLRFPRDREIIITDTVGFIKDIPRDLVLASKATLEELEDADLLLHVVDISNPRFEQHIASVENILKELHLIDKLRLMVFNKMNKASMVEVGSVVSRYNGVAISAINPDTMGQLLRAIEQYVWAEKGDRSASGIEVESEAAFAIGE